MWWLGRHLVQFLLGYGWYVKRTAVLTLSCILLSFIAVNSVDAQTIPVFSDADAVATALAAYNTADGAYNTALSVYNTANSAYVAAKANLDNTKAVFDAAVIENSAAASALTMAITDANAATKYMEDCRLLYFCPPSVYTAAVNDWYAKTAVYFAARDRQNASLASFNSSRDAYNAAIPLYNATVAPNNNAANALQTATAVRTGAYNFYIQTQTTFSKNKPVVTIPGIASNSSIGSAPAITNSKNAAISPAKKFKNCTELRKTFPKGVAKDAKSAGNTGAKVNAKVYKLNIGSDRDKDGVACELA